MIPKTSVWFAAGLDAQRKESVLGGLRSFPVEISGTLALHS